MNLLDTLRGLLPGSWRPASRGALALKDITQDGTLVPRRGAVRLPGGPAPPHGGAGRRPADRPGVVPARGRHQHRGGAHHAPGLGKPNTLAGALQERQERGAGLPGGVGSSRPGRPRRPGTWHGWRRATRPRPRSLPVPGPAHRLLPGGRGEDPGGPHAPDRHPLLALRGRPHRRGRGRLPGGRRVAGDAPAPKGLQIWSDASDRKHTEFYLNRDGAHVRRWTPSPAARSRSCPHGQRQVLEARERRSRR